tara:strand:+ start:557 stop:721 length:165 start_codon:yes stop_codon:yes gene_type:complete
LVYFVIAEEKNIKKNIKNKASILDLKIFGNLFIKYVGVRIMNIDNKVLLNNNNG